MNRKLIITKIDKKIFTLLLEDDIAVELRCTNLEAENNVDILGNIYIGRIRNVVPALKCAYVKISNDMECHYSMTDNPLPYSPNMPQRRYPCVGDEIVVQVSKESIKYKVPSVTSKLSFTGKYAVLTYGDMRVGVSSKIHKEEKARLVKIAEDYATGDYGIIMRTNSKDVSEEILRRELSSLVENYNHVMNMAPTRVCYSCLYRAPKQYLTELRNIYQDGLTDIIVEDEEIYEEVKEYLAKEQPEDLEKLRLYQDRLLPLHKVYSVESHIENALREFVWLKNGASLVIQPTEALTVIDVNSSKFTGKKPNDEAIYKINLMAAKEAARQIRLRNLSGIIIIDFINMESKEYMMQLLEEFNKLLQKDPIATTLVDMTKLQLVEVTRKKVRKPFHEAIRD